MILKRTSVFCLFIYAASPKAVTYISPVTHTQLPGISVYLEFHIRLHKALWRFTRQEEEMVRIDDNTPETAQSSHMTHATISMTAAQFCINTPNPGFDSCGVNVSRQHIVMPR